MKTFSDYGIHFSGSGEVSAICPECSNERKKKNIRCLSVNTEKGVWFCQHCGWNGTLNQKQNNAYTKPETPKHYERPVYEKKELSEKAFNFLVDERGISEAVLKRNQIGSSDGSIAFPYFKCGEVVNVKYRDAGKNFRQEKGAEKTVYGYDDIAKTSLITEGELDKLACETAGFPNTFSVPDGAPAVGAKNFSSKFSFLDNCESRLNEVTKFIIAVDSDEPGQLLEAELSRRLGLGRCWKVRWPKGAKDANDVLIQFGASTLKECIEAATPFPVEGIVYWSDLDLEDYYEKGDQPGISPGWLKLEEKFTLCSESGQLNIVTGSPMSGKSEFLDALMVNLVRDEAWAFGIFSPENFPFKYHARKLTEKFIGLPFFDNFKRRMNITDIREAKKFAEERMLFMSPSEDNLSVTAIIDLAKTLVYRHGIKGLIVDPWNELDHSRPNGQSETEYISQSLTKFRRFARLHNVHVFLVAHPRKLERDESKGYPVPSPYDISGSANWYNKADNCLAVWRDLKAENSEVFIHIQKIKKKYLGKLGVVELRYEYSTGRYLE